MNKTEIIAGCKTAIDNNLTPKIASAIRRYLASGAINIESHTQPQLEKILLTAALRDVLEDYEPQNGPIWIDIFNLENF